MSHEAAEALGAIATDEVRSWLGASCFQAVLRIRIRIHLIHVFLGLLYPDPDSLVRGMDPDPDPSIKQKW